jgi:hypothetical protein
VRGDSHARAVLFPQKDRTVSVEQEAAWSLELVSKFLRKEKSPVPAGFVPRPPSAWPVYSTYSAIPIG